MLKIARRMLEVSFLILVFAIGSTAQTSVTGAARREPTRPARPFVVRSSQSLAAVEAQLPANKVEELFGGEGMQLRVAVQHDKDKPLAQAEVHDASDDVYYVLEGSASLTLGGQLDAPVEVQPGEWRALHIIGGQTFEIKKGDLVIVPRGTPHQRSTAGRDFKTLLIKVFAVPVPTKQRQPTPKEQKP